MRLISYSFPAVERLNEDVLIEIINSKKIYCDATVMRAKRMITTIYPNYVGVSHKIKQDA
jgi:hypothetical protein